MYDTKLPQDIALRELFDRKNGTYRHNADMCRSSLPELLLLLGSAYGTYIRTSSALDAGIRVNNVLCIALGYCAYGTSVCAGTALDAII